MSAFTAGGFAERSAWQTGNAGGSFEVTVEGSNLSITGPLAYLTNITAGPLLQNASNLAGNTPGTVATLSSSAVTAVSETITTGFALATGVLNEPETTLTEASFTLTHALMNVAGATLAVYATAEGEAEQLLSTEPLTGIATTIALPETLNTLGALLATTLRLVITLPQILAGTAALALGVINATRPNKLST